MVEQFRTIPEPRPDTDNDEPMPVLWNPVLFRRSSMIWLIIRLPSYGEDNSSLTFSITNTAGSWSATIRKYSRYSKCRLSVSSPNIFLIRVRPTIE